MKINKNNLNAVNKGQNGSIENSDIDDVYQAFQTKLILNKETIIKKSLFH